MRDFMAIRRREQSDSENRTTVQPRLRKSNGMEETTASRIAGLWNRVTLPHH